MRGSTDGCNDTFHKVILKPRAKMQQWIHEKESEDDDDDSDKPYRKKSRHDPDTSSKVQRMVTRSQVSRMVSSSSSRTTTRSSKHQSMENKLVRANGLNCEAESGVEELNRHVHANGLNENLMNESSEKLNNPLQANGLKFNESKSVARKLCSGQESDQMECNELLPLDSFEEEDDSKVPIICYECSEFGHYSKDCTKFRMNEVIQQTADSTIQDKEFDFYMNTDDDQQMPTSSTRQRATDDYWRQLQEMDKRAEANLDRVNMGTTYEELREQPVD